MSIAAANKQFIVHSNQAPLLQIMFILSYSKTANNMRKLLNQVNY